MTKRDFAAETYNTYGERTGHYSGEVTGPDSEEAREAIREDIQKATNAATVTVFLDVD
jgi:hypothetical protein